MNENVNITVCTNVCMYKNIMYMTYVYMFRLNHQRRVLENELSCAHGKYLEIHKEQLKANLCKKLRYKTNIILYFFFLFLIHDVIQVSSCGKILATWKGLIHCRKFH